MDLATSNDTCKAAFQYAKKHMHPAILNHCIRVYLYAQREYEPSSVPLFVACILHDIGSCEVCSGTQRFEVEGADKAVQIMKEFKETEQDCHDVWVAIACHTCAGIAERITPLAASVRRAVLVDFGRLDSVDLQVESKYPRLDIEKVLGDAVVSRCLVSPKTSAPSHTWPGDLYRSHLEDPSNQGVNIAF